MVVVIQQPRGRVVLAARRRLPPLVPSAPPRRPRPPSTIGMAARGSSSSLRQRRRRGERHPVDGVFVAPPLEFPDGRAAAPQVVLENAQAGIPPPPLAQYVIRELTERMCEVLLVPRQRFVYVDSHLGQLAPDRDVDGRHVGGGGTRWFGGRRMATIITRGAHDEWQRFSSSFYQYNMY